MTTIRAVVAGDAAVISDLIAQLGRTPGADRLRTRIPALAGEVLVAEVDGVVVGVLHLHVTEFLTEPRGRVTTLVVADGYRSRGVGALLLAAAERLARERGCESMEVTSAGHRER